MVLEDYIIRAVTRNMGADIIPFRRSVNIKDYGGDIIDELEPECDELESKCEVIEQDEYEYKDIDVEFVSDCIIRESTKQEILEYMIDLIRIKYDLESSEEAIDNWGRFRKEFLEGLE